MASGLTLCVTQGLEGVLESVPSHKLLQAEAARLEQSAHLQSQMSGLLRHWDNALNIR